MAKKTNAYGYCTYCNANFDGEPIPEAEREGMVPPFIWNRRIKLIYNCSCESTVGLECPDCGIQQPICKEEYRA